MIQFVGEGHGGVVDELLDAFADVCDRRTPAWWSLEANTGWGKTRVVQEFYARLAAAQESPGYWPASMLPEDAATGGRDERKVIQPPLVNALSGSAPRWFWWGVSCERRRAGEPLNALIQDAGRFRDRELAIRSRLAQLHPAWRRLKETMGDRWRDVAEGSFVESVGAGASVAGAGLQHVGLPGIGLMFLFGKWGLEGRRKAKERRGFERSGEHGERDDLVADLAQELTALTRAGIPLLIVVEDLHDADPQLVELVCRLLGASSAPVMLVTTCWRGLLEQRAASELLERVPEDRRRRVRCEDEVSALSLADLEVIADGVLPGLDDAGRQRLAHAFPNPLALQLACRTGRIIDEARHGSVSAETVSELPREVDRLFGLLWAELPERLRRVLMVADQLAPESVGHSHARGPEGRSLLFGDLRWDPELVALAIANVQRLANDLPDVAAALKDAHEVYGWVRAADGCLQRFHDPAQHQFASAEFRDQYGASRLEILWAGAKAASELGDRGGASPQRRLNHDRLLVALAYEHVIPWGPPSADAAVRICDDALRLGGTVELTRALAIAEAALADADLDPASAIDLGGVRASCCGGLGRAADAVTQLELLLDADAALPPDAWDTLRLRGDHAFFLSEAGRVDEAIAAYEQLVPDMTEALGGDAPVTFAALNNLALARAWAGQSDRAVTELERLLEAQTRLRGPLAPETLTVRNNLANRSGEVGRIEDAIAELRHCVEARTQVLGPEAQRTLSSRNDVAYWLGRSGRVDEAIDAFEQVIEDQTRVLGPDAVGTLDARRSLAGLLAASRPDRDTVAMLEQMVRADTRLLGPDASGTLSARNDLAYCRARTGDLNEAIAEFEPLVDDLLRVLGPNSPRTVDTQFNLAYCLAGVGRLDEAITMNDRILQHPPRESDSDARARLRIRDHLAACLMRAGKTERALAEAVHLLEDQTRLLGPEDPATLSTRNNMAGCLGALGEVDRAVGVLEALLEDQTRVLGAGSAETVATRTNLAYWLTVNGQ